jgi:hypothetical protein
VFGLLVDVVQPNAASRPPDSNSSALLWHSDSAGVERCLILLTRQSRSCRMTNWEVGAVWGMGGIFTFIQVTIERSWVFLQDLARPDNSSTTSTASLPTLPPASIPA